LTLILGSALALLLGSALTPISVFQGSNWLMHDEIPRKLHEHVGRDDFR